MKMTKKQFTKHAEHYHYYLGVSLTITAGIIFLLFKYYMLFQIPVYIMPDINIPHRQKATTTECISKLEKKYNDQFLKLGKMGNAMKLAADEFGTSTEMKIVLKGLLLGIANAESSMGKSFAIEYDKNCHNWWGMKGGNMTNRKDGSSLRCFLDETAGARTEAKLLADHYIGEGLNKPETIVYKYVGKKWDIYHGTWVNNVNKYFAKL
jgi:hypothetical protein